MSTLIKTCIECGLPYHLLNWWQKLFTKWESAVFCSRGCAEEFVESVIGPRPIKPRVNLTLIQGGKK